MIGISSKEPRSQSPRYIQTRPAGKPAAKAQGKSGVTPETAGTILPGEIMLGLIGPPSILLAVSGCSQTGTEPEMGITSLESLKINGHNLIKGVTVPEGASILTGTVPNLQSDSRVVVELHLIPSGDDATDYIQDPVPDPIATAEDPDFSLVGHFYPTSGTPVGKSTITYVYFVVRDAASGSQLLNTKNKMIEVNVQKS